MEVCAGLGLTEDIKEQQDKEGTPADDEGTQDYQHSLEQAQGPFAAVPRTGLPRTGLDQLEDGDVEANDPQEDDAEHDHGEKDVVLGVERQEDRAGIEVAQTVPAQQRKQSNDEGKQPAGNDQAA